MLLVALLYKFNSGKIFSMFWKMQIYVLGYVASLHLVFSCLTCLFYVFRVASVIYFLVYYICSNSINIFWKVINNSSFLLLLIWQKFCHYFTFQSNIFKNSKQVFLFKSKIHMKKSANIHLNNKEVAVSKATKLNRWWSFRPIFDLETI